MYLLHQRLLRGQQFAEHLEPVGHERLERARHGVRDGCLQHAVEPPPRRVEQPLVLDVLHMSATGWHRERGYTPDQQRHPYCGTMGG